MIVKYTFDEICDSQDFDHDHEFVEYSEYEKLKSTEKQVIEFLKETDNYFAWVDWKKCADDND